MAASTFEERCYVVYGIGFTPLKIKRLANKQKLIDRLKKQQFHPKSSLLNPNSRSGKQYTTKPTPY